MTTIRSNNVSIVLLPIGFLVLFFCGCRPAETETQLIVAVSLEPQAFLVDRIGGDRVRSIVVVPTGREPENYQPTPEKIAALCKAKGWFQTGMPFEAMLRPKIASLVPTIKFVDLRQGIPLRKLELHAHAHGDHADCSDEEGNDPHIWLGPTALKTQAETVLKTLLEFDPLGEPEYRLNCKSLLDEIEKTRRTVAEALQPYRNAIVFVFHPAYGYFCDEFGLRQQAVEFEGKSPTTKQLADLVVLAKQEKVPPTIFVQPEFNRGPADAIAEATEGNVVVHSPLERDILANLVRLSTMIAETHQPE